jgi:hypothetical protein
LSQVPGGLEKEELWKLLVDTAHALPMYKNHKRYVEDVMAKEKPEISPQELSVQLNIPLGEALVLLGEVRAGKSQKSSDRSLSDFSV